MTYQPQPIDLSRVKLSEDIEELTEQLAWNVHEVWAEQRIEEGWNVGPVRDDAAKQHPCLVPFEELTESEKQYDRNAAMQTLKAILALGYRIVPGSTRQHAPANREAGAIAEADRLLSQMVAAKTSQSDQNDGELSLLLKVWGSRREENREWYCQPELYRYLGRRFLTLGEAPLAREVAQTALELTEADENGERYPLWSDDVELRQIYGLALARSGSPEFAQRVLTELREEGNVDEETLGILARVHKDLALRPGIDTEQRRDRLDKALERYKEAYQLSGGFWTGINVASLHRLLGQEHSANEVAERVRKSCQADLERLEANTDHPEQTYWHVATLAEAALVQGDFDEASKWYQRAQHAASRNYGNLQVTRRHARLLLDYWIASGTLGPQAASWLDDWLPISPVVVFTGHMIDPSGREQLRFPDSIRESVESAIEHWLKKHQVFIGFSSAACGSDLLFQKVIQQRGGESRIVLPYDRVPFKQHCVEYAGEFWTDLYDQVVDRATQLIVASPKRTQGDDISYDYANLILHGLATVRAAELDSRSGEPLGLTVWNGGEAEGRGGTAHTVNNWRTLGMEVHQIDLSEIENRREQLPIRINPKVPASPSPTRNDDSADTRIMAMLFGDAVNFSQLDEQQVGRFIEHFMHPIGNIIRSYGKANTVRNTWGDGIYLVFDHVREAGLCGLEICTFVRNQIESDAWRKHHLPEGLNVRIALHAGPVFGCVDPITGIKNYTGTHVSRAARLEPKTPPGEVYASEAFAAISTQYAVREYSCHYVKQLAWAKHYGSFPTFVVRSADRQEGAESGHR